MKLENQVMNLMIRMTKTGIRYMNKNIEVCIWNNM